jgi:2-polyprenyl-6-methoxyphenol hydroxylase-like FAD-dependent oxidoreductase
VTGSEGHVGLTDVVIVGGGIAGASLAYALASLVVGADRQHSTVRRQVGLSLDRQPAVSHITGLLVDGLGDVPDDHDVMVMIADSDLLLLMVFPEDAANRTARLGLLSKKLATTDPELFPLITGLHAGPDTIPDELVDDRILVQIRNA